ncbi:hypothetical protein BC937DRAFT_89419 [Endogone sp. FLAS-F59071]|nr:hypothetical protein BC937DRAFT_89419 [Endogone sp. FLAS-F59071]|eukprot:RUS17846.1 hypothetical protein BC937DRAFT_89419 [Endogone sp. FLAS-F59071]
MSVVNTTATGDVRRWKNQRESKRSDGFDIPDCHPTPKKRRISYYLSSPRLKIRPERKALLDGEKAFLDGVEVAGGVNICILFLDLSNILNSRFFLNPSMQLAMTCLPLISISESEWVIIIVDAMPKAVILASSFTFLFKRSSLPFLLYTCI